MNWLTAQLSQRPESFASLADLAQRFNESSLRRLTYSDLSSVVAPVDVIGLEGQDQLADAFILVEDAVAADARLESAIESRDPIPPSFTLAIDDGSGNVLYVPEEAEELPSLQLFTDSGDRLGRVRADGSFGPNYATLEHVTTLDPVGRCSDGPCVDWGAGCGAGCMCQKYEILGTDEGFLPSLFQGGGPGRRYGLRCR